MRSIILHNPRALALAASVLYAIAGSSLADDRELAADGDKIRLTIAADYQCAPETTIKAISKSSEYFDQDALTLQRLVNTSRAILGFECNNIESLTLNGLTDSTLVFQARAHQSDGWGIQTEPAPLEALALVYGLYEPSFSHLGTLDHQLEPYRDITGINKTFQFHSYEQQIHRMLTVVTSDTTEFQNYLKESGKQFPSFELALAHYQSILNVIKDYTPEHFDAYQQAYSELSGSLKDHYWESQLKAIISEDNTVTKIFNKAEDLLQHSNSPEFKTYVDDYLSQWLITEVNRVNGNPENSSLQQIKDAQIFFRGFPGASPSSQLTKFLPLASTLRQEHQTSLEQRVKTLTGEAKKRINNSGHSYLDIGNILKSGLKIAEEFETAGYPQNAEALTAFTITRINTVLSSGLEAFKADLSKLDLTSESTAALQTQSQTFAELATEFDNFKPYKAAIDHLLKAKKDSICSNILTEAGAATWQAEKSISLVDGAIPMVDFTCELFANGHTLSKFSWEWWSPLNYEMTIDEANGNQRRFSLKLDIPIFGDNFHVQSRIDDDENSEADEIKWQSYLARLILPPPSGTPDSQGIRECDRLAADPYDTKKLAPGVKLEDASIEDLDRAIDACIAALENDPNDHRQQFQLGRLLWHSGDQENAIEYMALASQAEYPPALYYQAEIMLGTSEDPDAFIDALNLFKASGAAGYLRGNAMVKELNPDGIDFFKEIPAPSNQQVFAALSDKGKSASILGVTSSFKVTGVKIKDCFQTNASDFSCEYKPILKCGMSGYGNDPVVKLMSGFMQASCNVSEYTFGNFRKLNEQQWKQLPGTL